MHLARAAQRARIPYTLGMAGGATIEEIARVAPDVFWFQLYRLAKDEHAIGLDLVRRAEAAGCRTLVLTLDVPVRTTRPREVATGIAGAFNVNLAILSQIARSPAWALAVWKHGVPRFANLRSYVGADASLNEVIAFAQRELRGAFTWDDVAPISRPLESTLIVKGILHPQDAEQAVALGVDGMYRLQSRRTSDRGLAGGDRRAAGDRQQAGKRATVMMDSGVRSGTDIVRAYALGAAAAFAGKAFLWGLGALGEEGPGPRHRYPDRGDAKPHSANWVRIGRTRRAMS